MRLLYSLLLYLATPFVVLRLLWRGLKQREYWQRIGERFGYVPRSGHGVAVWIHAVSVGESIAALPLIRAMIDRHPPRSVLVTTTTPTGSERIRAALGDKVLHTYLPYDLPHVVARYIARMRPKRLIVMETEIWPNLFRALAAERIPVAIVNARLSPRSFANYLRIRRSMRGILRDCRLIAAQSQPDAERFLRLGADEKIVHAVGNLKFDQPLPSAQLDAGAAWREAWGTSRPVWCAASTHEGEEEAALSAHAAVLREFPDALLLLVPRHPQRFDSVEKLCEKSGMSRARRSALALPADLGKTQVLLGDSMGELNVYLGASDVAFVAGSFAPVGGHNVLEPAAAGVPVLFGPHMFNFEQARQVLLDSGAARELPAPEALASAVIALLKDPATRASMGRAGRAVTNANRGALERLLTLLS